MIFLILGLPLVILTPFVIHEEPRRTAYLVLGALMIGVWLGES